MYRLAFRLTGAKADAEDLVQDVLVKLFARGDEILNIRDLGPWLSRVLYNHFVDDRRRYGRMPVKLVGDADENEFVAPDSAAPEVLAGAAQDQARLLAALDKLPEEQRVVVLLHDAEGYKLGEIEALTGTPVGTLKSRLHRARSRLAEILSKNPEKTWNLFQRRSV